MNNITFAINSILSRRRYLMIFVISTLIFYAITAVVFQWQYISWVSLINPWKLFILGFYLFVKKITFINTIILSILSGLLISILFYRYELLKIEINQKIGIFASIGIFLGLAVPGCVSCGVGLAVALGLGSSLARLPFQGNEISFIAMAILIFSIWKISKNLTGCELKY